MYQLVAVVCSINVFDNGDFFQFRAYGYGNPLCCGNARLAWKLWIERFPDRAIQCTRTLISVVQHLRDHDGTFKPQTHDRGRDRIERILQCEEQILERVKE
mgnify:CR=1 FL=1